MQTNNERDWATLHFRAASGEILTEDEATYYREGLEQRHKEERLSFDMEALRQVRNNILVLEAERAQLEKERLLLQTKIAHLEPNLSNL